VKIWSAQQLSKSSRVTCGEQSRMRQRMRDDKTVWIRQRSWNAMTSDLAKDIDLDTVPEPEPEEPAIPAPKEGEGNIEEP
jgi:hypothetical protein